MLNSENYFEMNELANQCRKEWDVSEYDSIDIFQVALNKIKNLTIVFTDLGEYISGASNKSEDNVIFINSTHSLGRQRFTLAHEIYHLKYDTKKYNICNINSDEEIERKANDFASSLLMPHSALLNFKKEHNIINWDLDSIIMAEQFFQISHHAFLWRIRKLDEISYKQFQNFKNYPIHNASLRGYDIKLYRSFTSEKFFTIGNYLKLTEELFANEIISHGKKEELLADAYRQDLIYNTRKGDVLIE